MMRSLPTWDELPCMPGSDIKGCAWSVWSEGKEGGEDNLGTVNLLRPEVILAAKDEIRTGRTCRLDWALNYPERPGLGRIPFEHKILRRGSGARDDQLHFNGQSSTQIDGLRHYGFHDLGTWYGGARADELFPAGEPRVTQDNERDPKHSRLSIHHWARHTITGRGVLLDVARFADQIGLPDFHPFGHQTISAEQLQAVAKLEGVDFRQGDVLLMRTSLVGQYKAASAEQQDEWLRHKAVFSGVEKSDDMRRFLWNQHFSAVGGDAIAFEAMPVPDGGRMLHCDILTLWGCPIFELMDLEELSEMCQELGRWSFFFTSLPLYVIGGVSSPPNAMATF